MIRFSMAWISSSVSMAKWWSWSMVSQRPPLSTMGTMALPVMSPPRIRTSALWKGPAFRNFRQHTSDPCTSVA